MIRITEPDGTILDPDDPFVALPRYMAAVSYARYRVGWVPNLEYVFWGEVLQLDEPDSAVFTRPEQSWGYRVFRLRKMKRLSGAVGGWFHRPEGAPKLLFVPLDEWVELYAAYHSPLTR